MTARRFTDRCVPFALLVCVATAGAQTPTGEARNPILDPQFRDRYQEALRRNPYQDRAFDAMFSSYFASDGLEAWIAALQEPDERSETHTADLILLGRIHARLFESEQAIGYLEQIEGDAARDPKLNVLLGSLYDNAGRPDDCIARLNDALKTLTDPDERANAARILGEVLIRAGRVDEAAETWERIAGDNDDVFALLALAEIYETNQKWPEAVGAHNRIIEASEENPYRQCSELRAIGDIHVRTEQYADAVAAYETALELVAPGNWLFADLKKRLIAAYEAWGNLPAFADYLKARIESDASDVEFRVILAETQERLGRVDDAVTTLRSALDRAPDHIRANGALLELYANAGRVDELQRSLAALVDRFPGDTEYRRRLGEAYLKADDSTKAIETWRGAIGANANASRHALVAGWFERYEFSGEAIQAYEAALALEDSRDWQLRLADLHFQNDAPNEAVRVWTSTLNAEGTTPADYVEVAMLLAARELLDDAEALLQEAIELEPNNGQTKLNLAKLLVRRGLFEQALPHFAALADQHEFAYLRERGIDGLLDAYSSLGLLQTKKDEWERAAANAPDSLNLLARLAKLELRMGNKRRVVDLYERCAELAPGDAAYQLAMARAYRTNEQPLKAIDTYKRLIQQDNARAAGYYRELATLCVEEGHTEEAVTVAQAIVKRAPANHAALRGLARAYSANGQRNDALDSFRKALQLKPGDPELLREYGDMLARQGSFGEAQEAYRALLAAAPHQRGRLEALRLLAALYKDRGNSDELVREFRVRAEQTPDDVRAQEELAAVYSASGRGERAVEVLEDALRYAANEEAGLRKLLRAAYEANDLEKVVAVHYQLEAVRGELSPREHEQLGVAYARLGDHRNAIEAWNVLFEQRPSNPATLESLARTMREEGFTNRALKVSARAVELEPYNYAMRYQYAIRLALADRLLQATEQLETILVLGDRSTEESEGELPFTSSTNESVLGQQRQGLSKKPPLALLQSLGKNWQGSFNEFRRVAIFALIHIARETGTAGHHTESFRQAVADDPKSGRAKEDLLIVYQAGERWAAALDIANTLAESQPDNLWLLREIALMTQKSKRIESSIDRQDEHMQTFPESWVAGSLSVLPLLYQQGRIERAEETVRKILDGYGNEPRILHPLASVLRGFGDAEDVIPLYERILELNPQDRNGIAFKLGRLYENQGQYDAAQSVYERLLFDERASVARTGQLENRPSRFLPHGYFGTAEVIHRFGWDVDVQRIRAFDALVNMNPETTDVPGAIARIRTVAEQYDPSADTRSARVSLDLIKLLLVYWIEHDAYEAATAFLDQVLLDGVRDSDLTNFNFFAEKLNAALGS